AAVYSSRQEQVALIWIKLANVAVAFIPTLVFAFTLAVCQRLKKMRWALTAALLGSALFALCIVLTNRFVAGTYHYSWGWYARYGALSLPFLAGFVGLAAASMSLFWQEYTHASSAAAKRRFRILCIAFGVAFSGSIDYLPAYGVPVYPLGYIFISLFLMIAARAIWKYRLVDITPSLAARQMISTMRDAVLIIDCEGVIRVANPAAAELFDHPLHDLIGQPVRLLDPPVFTETMLARFLRSPAPQHQEIHAANQKGRELYLELYCSVLPDAAGQPIGMVCMARDVSERKRAQAALRESANYAENIIDTVRESLVVLDSNLKIRSANRAFYQTFSTTPEKSHQRYIHEIGPGQWSNLSTLRGMFKLLPTDRLFEDIELDYEFPEGAKTFLLSARRLIRRDRQTEMILLAMEEVTQQKRAQSLLKAAIAELEATQAALRSSRPSPSGGAQAA
ncbi:MAG: PAS domain-containing protein, partial [Candidatus Omnitrophica bacterium]|nr:PAS domain-containing protein [Candidatus Omnitrophota bacterium]